MFHVAFIEPRIPPNTGNAIRMAAATGVHLHLVEPLGFTMTDTQLRRAGLDYHDLATVTVHPSLAHLWDAVLPAQVYAFTASARTSYADIAYAAGDVLMFGSEPDGLAADVLADPHVTDRVRIPMLSGRRSLNLANAAGVAIYEAWRQHGFSGRPMTSHRYGLDPSQFGELSLPTGDRRPGTVVIIHGGFWGARYDLSLGRPLAADLAGRGYAVWNLEYRRVGNGGGWPTTFDDVANGIDVLADLDVDTSRLVAIGHSAGGHLAAWAAGRIEPRVALTAVVAQAGVLDLVGCARENLGGGAAQALLHGPPEAHPDRYRRADPLTAVPLPIPVLCLHSRGDDRVPFAQSVRYVEAATAAGGNATLHELHGDHFTLIDPGAPDWAAAVAALPGLLAG